MGLTASTTRAKNLVADLKLECDLETVKKTFNHEVDINYRDEHERNLLFYAGYNKDIVKFLIEKGVNPNKFDVNGSPAAIYATDPESIEILLKLLGKKINNKNITKHFYLTDKIKEQVSKNNLVINFVDTESEHITKLVDAGFCINKRCTDINKLLSIFKNNKNSKAIEVLTSYTTKKTAVTQNPVVPIVPIDPVIKALEDAYIAVNGTGIKEKKVENTGTGQCSVCLDNIGTGEYLVSTCCPNAFKIHTSCYERGLACFICKEPTVYKKG